MTADNANLKNALSGAFMEIAVVDSIGEAGESESIVGFTMGETTVTSEDTTTEFQFHESRWVQRFNEHEALGLEFVTSLAADMPQLETLGIVDSNGEPKARQELDLRIHVYADEPANAGSPQQTLEFYRCEVNFNEMTLPQDGSEVTFQVDANGGYHVGSTSP
ncbi:hypothetical protein SAMN04487947_1221 [Halogeometricum rufum]|uniref:Uncharacterized protein n=1 Tax=Halogeometricum rufum TaxID=553469 RepID=A0A1I6GIU0_9EURY|nr:hypothetical protein [Halogeometricum rufum]SFR42080.1 hypothetical protein SAMN04487947_1221 [Halogeometricum rufum]